MIRGTDYLRRVARQHDVASAITPHDLWLDALAGAIGRGIHMRTEANDRNLFVRIHRDGRRGFPLPATRLRAGGPSLFASQWRDRSLTPGPTGCRSPHSAESARLRCE